MSYSFDQAKDEVAKLVKHFTTNRAVYIASAYKEAHARQEFIDPLFMALNWDVQNRQHAAPDYREVVAEDSLDIEGQRKAPDYAFRVGRDRKFFVEAKKPGVDLKTATAPAYQLRRYAWSAKLPLSLLTDFEELAVYDCRIRPTEKQKANVARVEYFKCDEYADRWRDIWDVFSRDAVWGGSFDQFTQTSKGKRGTSEVDAEFLKEIEGWRDVLAKNIALRNTRLTIDELNDAVQRTIDRLIFLRMAEDRGIEDYGQLQRLAAGEGIYAELLKLSRKADAKYNSGLFDFTKAGDTVTPKLTVDDGVLSKILSALYYPQSPYEFSVLPAEILGNIYEQFLGKTIRLTAGHNAKVEDKPEVKKAGGVYYTPAYIVEYIVKHTVGQQIEGKSPKQLKGFRVLDPACGSGSFLLGAYKFLLDHYQAWYAEHTPEKNTHAIRQQAGAWRLTTTEKKRVLTEHIFGVDIDRQAVEVTKLSLLLKVLEGESNESLGQQLQLFQERALPNLDQNIKCGNSLIGPDYFSGQLTADPDELRRVNPFDWAAEFPEAMQTGGFDCVIGNPPYLNVDDTWGKGDARLNALKQLYPHIYNDKTDILFYFLAKAAAICNGYVGAIVSRAFLEAYKADKLRGYLASHTAIRSIVDFRNCYIFPGAAITTCIVTLQPGAPPNLVTVHKILQGDLPSSDLPKHLIDPAVFESIKVRQNTLDSRPWAMASPAIANLNIKIDSVGDALDKILIIGKGMETGRNDVFGERTREDITRWHVKPGGFYKRATNSDIQRYSIRDRGEYILYPQPATAFDKLPAGVQKHLTAHAGELKDRAAYKRGDCEWWKYTWPLHKEYYNRRRIICPYLATCNRFALDATKEFLSLTDTTVLFENEQPENLLFLLGLLNSQLLSFRFRSIGKLKGGGIYEYFWNSVSKLPIRRINFSDPADKARHDKTVILVEQMLGLHKRKAGAKDSAEEMRLQRVIDSTDKQIDALVYELYGLSPEEIVVVENGKKSNAA